jgi:hypothetical protein
MGTDSTSGSRVSARPPSSTSELFDGIYASGEVATAVSGEAWVQAMLDVEAALGGPQRTAEQIGGVLLHMAAYAGVPAANAAFAIARRHSRQTLPSPARATRV